MPRKARPKAPAETKREAYERLTKPQRDRLAAWTFKGLPDTSELVGLIRRALDLHSAGAVVGYDLISDISNAAAVLDTSEALGVILPLQLSYTSEKMPPEARDMRSRLQAVIRTCDTQRQRHTLTDAEANRLRELAEQLKPAEPKPDDVKPEAWTENDKRTIRVWLEANRADLLSVEQVVDRMELGDAVSPATVKATRKKLLAAGYLETPNGPRSGARLNTKGRRMAEKLSLD